MADEGGRLYNATREDLLAAYAWAERAARVLLRCETCGGEGRILHPDSRQQPYACPACDRSGIRVEVDCESCGGEGHIESERDMGPRTQAVCPDCGGSGIQVLVGDLRLTGPTAVQWLAENLDVAAVVEALRSAPLSMEDARLSAALPEPLRR